MLHHTQQFDESTTPLGQHAQSRPRAAGLPRAFTLIELMISVSIIVILMLLAVPFLSAMQQDMAMSGAENAIKAAVTSARGYADRAIEFDEGTYDGAAIIFRWNETKERMEMVLLENSGAVIDTTSGDPFETTNNNHNDAYAEISGREPIILPGTIGVVGLRRGGSGNGYITFIGPATYNSETDTGSGGGFAVRFDENGVLQSFGGNDNQKTGWVFYDKNFDGSFSFSSNDSSYSAASVPAIIVFDLKEFVTDSRTSGIDWPFTTSTSSSLASFLNDPEVATPMFFSRYTGTVMQRDVE